MLTERPAAFRHMGYKTTGALVGLLMIVMWTLSFFIGQVLPAIMPGENASIVINWAFYFAGLLILTVMTIVIILLHVLWKVAFAGEQYIA